MISAENSLDAHATVIGHEDSIPELVRLIADNSAGCKQNAMDIVMMVGFKVCLPILEAAVRNDDDADLRNGAMEVLVSFGELAVPYLTKLLTDHNEEVRNFSAVMLGDIGNAKAVMPLIDALKDVIANVRHAAAEALGKIGDKQAESALLEMGKGDMWDQFYSAAALEMLSRTKISLR